MATNAWELMRELATMQDRMNRIWGNVLERGTEDVTSRGWVPPVDIYENEAREIVLKAELPGLRREDIELTVENTTLTIRGERRRDETIPNERYHRMERQYGPFSRSFTLPNTLDASRVHADYREGVLTMTLPLRAEARPRQIEVEVKE
jgi:HSP20 family protein